LLIWGGETSGGEPADPHRYDPLTDTWSVVNATALPPAAGGTRALWTGSELLLMGGYRYPGGFSTGVGRYNPVTDSWKPFPSENEPQSYYGDAIVWTGREAIVWGAPPPLCPGCPVMRRRGVAFDAAADTWSVISDRDQPGAGSYLPLAVFATGAGTRGTGLMLVVAGPYQGGAYDPASDRWWPISMQGSVPGDYAIWTGTEMLVWGTRVTEDSAVTTGARYRP
jgi:hypothetical protein